MTIQEPSGTDARASAAAVIEKLAAVTLDMAAAEDEATMIHVACSAPARVLGRGAFVFSPAGNGPPGATAVFGRHGVAGWLHPTTDGDDPAMAALLGSVARLFGASLANLRQREHHRLLREGLARDRAYFEQLFASAPEGIVVLDGEDRIVRVNDEFQRMFGYGAAELEGRVLTELIVPPELREAANELTMKVVAGQPIQVETVRRRRDGSTFPVSILGTPIVVGGDQVAGYGIYRDITVQKEAEETLRRLSTTDELTGLYNRRGFFVVAEQQRKLAIRRNAQLLLLYLDIDNFKTINDTHGHLAGDQVLADLGALLRDCYRDSDILARMSSGVDVVARMGGDEFVVLAVDAGSNGEQVLLARLRERLAEYNASRADGWTVSLSVGAVRVAAGPDTSIDAIVAAADRLMYEDKRSLLKL